jgi:hypothetical protein
VPASICASITNPKMNPERPDIPAWAALSARGAARIRPGFAEEVLREVRRQKALEPSLGKLLALSAATAAVCLLAVALVDARRPSGGSAGTLAAWQQIASASDDLTQSQ